jgi:SAM-dependent methyltransferase
MMKSPSTLNINELKKLFHEVGLYNPKGELYKERTRKYAQLFAYIVHLESALKKLSSKRPITLVDCGCGKSYLSFLFYEYCQRILNRKVNIIGLDHNQTLIDQCKNIAASLGYASMSFYSTALNAHVFKQPVDIVYSLHACDTATDDMIAQAVHLKAKYIFSVSCCQHTNRRSMRCGLLSAVSRFQPYKERLVDMLGDSMRALLLEHIGYGVKLFEFVPAEQTPKNILLRAVHQTVKKQDQQSSLKRYHDLVQTFRFKPKLETLIAGLLYNDSFRG